LLEAVIDAPPPGPVEASAVAASKAQILTEASDALIDAGLLPHALLILSGLFEVL